MLKLTKNEREILKLLVRNSDMSDTKIAQKLKITKQAVGFIKRKLKQKRVIKNYTVNVDFEMLGIKVFGMITIKVKEAGWIFLRQKNLHKKVFGSSNMISCFSVSRGDIGVILIYAFKSLKELENYFQRLQVEFIKYFEIKDIYIFSNEGVLKDSPEYLLIKTLDIYGKGTPLEPFPVEKMGVDTSKLSDSEN